MDLYHDRTLRAILHLEALRCSNLEAAETDAPGCTAQLRRCSLPQGHSGACEYTAEDIIEWAKRWDPGLAEELMQTQRSATGSFSFASADGPARELRPVYPEVRGPYSY